MQRRREVNRSVLTGVDDGG